VARYEILKFKDFRILFVMRVLSIMSLQAQAVIVGWHVYALSHDPLLLGLIGLAEAVPAIGFAFLSGHVVDNRRPLSIYRLAIWILVLNAAMIWITALPVMPLDAKVRLGILFFAVFISGMVRSFTSPSTFALISHIVPRKNLSEASALNTWAFQCANIVGPAIGGLLYGSFGVVVAFSFPLVMMSLSLIPLYFFSHSTVIMQSQNQREAFLTSVLSGVRFALGQKVLLSAMTLDMVSVFFGGAVAVLPMFSDQVLHTGSTGLGLLRAAPSVGSGVVAFFLAFFPLRTISGRDLLVVVAGFGLCIIGFAFSNTFALAFFFLVVSGVFDGVSMVIRNTILQLLTPTAMRGRISSLSLIFITSSNEIGAFESGVAAKILGLLPSLVFGGAMSLLVVATTVWRAPELRKARIQPGDL
jgi:MFS family permease